MGTDDLSEKAYGIIVLAARVSDTLKVRIPLKLTSHSGGK